MTKPVLAALLLLFVAICAMASSKSIEEHDRKLIREAKQIPVSQLDSALPSATFEKWLAIEAGAGAEFHWEVNDCGERTGSAADLGRDFPVCVEAQATMADRRMIIVSIAVGTSKKEAIAKPVLYFAQLVTPDKRIGIRHLSDLPAELIKTHTSGPVQIAK